MFSIFSGEGRIMSKYRSKVAAINRLEERFAPLTDEQLKGETAKLKQLLADGKTLDDILPEAFALVREAAKRTLGQRHYDVQLVGGMVLHNSSIAEMRTGEGKTLVATLPAFLNALSGKGVHVVTVNDYLARRDGVWMGQVYALLGLSVGVINTNASYLYDPTHKEEDSLRDEVASFRVMYDFLRPSSRRDAYHADITYGTNNEFGFDYLRDNIEYDPNNLRQREYNYAIVDEIDSILIDEARTPLIISAPSGDSENLYETFAGIASKLQPEKHYTVDEKFKQIQLTDEGISAAEKMLGVGDIYTEKGIKYVHHLETAVRAKALFKKEKEYVVKDGEIIIVDEFTGRLQPGRRWSEGLHQAVEAKEGVIVQKESRTYASITFQNYFRLYKKLSGMTGTAATSKEEFYKVYGLDVATIPTNKPIVREDKNDLVFQTENGKFMAVAKKVKELHEKGQPVLVGTVSIEKNEALSEYLNRTGVPHEVLNAKNHEREGEIIAAAGRQKAVTIATNMAGRGVDIKLGGINASPEDAQKVRELGGLFVIGTERHEARRIDNQLRGRSGRQGDPGVTEFYVSLEDSLMRIFASGTVKRLMGKAGLKEDEPIESFLISRGLESAQSKIEGIHFDSRKHTLQYDDVMNYQRLIVYGRRRKLLLNQGDELKNCIDEILDIEHLADDIRQKIESKKQEIGEADFYTGLRRLMLQTIDMFWIDHLEQMEYLRSSVNLRAYGQRDPLIEYKREGLTLFKSMQQAILDQVLNLIPALQKGAFVEGEKEMKNIEAQAVLLGGSATSDNGASHASSSQKIGRNDRIVIVKDGQTKEIKFKQFEQYEKEGWKKQ